ncbi:MAG TPA: hypothetical protein VNW94_18515 [Streptosporangiaceae bacterium]|jgi:hypothetical protein|nr:hypothetical protein [Streptosporangiaceae bacterium]
MPVCPDSDLWTHHVAVVGEEAIIRAAAAATAEAPLLIDASRLRADAVTNGVAKLIAAGRLRGHGVVIIGANWARLDTLAQELATRHLFALAVAARSWHLIGDVPPLCLDALAVLAKAGGRPLSHHLVARQLGLPAVTAAVSLERLAKHGAAVTRGDAYRLPRVAVGLLHRSERGVSEIRG